MNYPPIWILFMDISSFSVPRPSLLGRSIASLQDQDRPQGYKKRKRKEERHPHSTMKTIIIFSLVLLAAYAFPGTRPSGRPHGGKHVTHPPLTEEQKKKFEEEFEKKVAKLSPEAQEAAKKIKNAFEENRGDFKAVHKAIDEIISSVSESVKKELESLRPKGGHHNKNQKEYERHRGSSRGPRGTRRFRSTTASN